MKAWKKYLVFFFNWSLEQDTEKETVELGSLHEYE